MVAIVTGSTLGLFNSSLSVLGAQGSNGNAALGQGNENIYVNAATGNLVIRHQDEFLSSQGLDASLVRTYNSQGLMDDDNGDNWRLNVAYLHSLTGTLNTSGNIRRVGGDGAETVYSYNSTKGHYFSANGDGAHDRVEYDAANDAWIWTDGSRGTREIYSLDAATNTYQLRRREDRDGNALVYSYNADGLISEIREDKPVGESQAFVIHYDPVNTDRITGIETRTLDADGLLLSINRTSYSYDASGRLEKLIVDLTPENSADAEIYETTYSYALNADGTESTRISDIVQSDGTSIHFTYEAFGTPEVYRIKTLTDGLGVTTTLDYDTAGRTTHVTNDALGTTTSYTYDFKNQLVGMASATLSDGSRISQGFEYDYQGNVTAVIDGNGQRTDYMYDTHGNRVWERNAEGHVVVRRYDAAYQLIAETRYSADQAALVTDWSQSFDTDFAGLENSAGLNELPAGIIAHDSASGQLQMLPNAVPSGESYELFGSNAYAFEEGLVFRQEINLSAGSQQRYLGITNRQSGVDARMHRIWFSSNYAFGDFRSGALAGPSMQYWGLIDVDTTYIFEAVVEGGGTSLYLYQQGQTRDQGYRHHVDGSDWGEVYAYMRTDDLQASTGGLNIERLAVQHEDRGDAQIQRYIYDDPNDLQDEDSDADEHHLRFVISPEGRVTEYRYNAAGQRVAEIAYTGNPYNLDAYNEYTTPTELDLQDWVAQQDLTQTQRVDTWYDFRGNVSIINTYARVVSSGQGDLGTVATTRYIYDAQGRLLQRIDPRQEESVLWQQDFSAGSTSGLGTLPAGYMAVVDDRLVLTAQENTSAIHPSVYGTRQHDSSVQVVYRAEITTTGDVSDRRIIYGMDGRSADNVNRRHAARIINGNWYTHHYDNGWRSTNLGAVDSNTTYVVEVSLTATGSRLYIYKQGEARDSLYVHELNDTDWDYTRSVIQGYGNVGVANTQVYIDNLSETVASNDHYSNYTTQYVYDGLGRMIASTDAQGVTVNTQHTLGGAVIQRFDANGLQTFNYYDANGRLITTRQLDELDSLLGTTHYEYDSAGRLRMETDAEGNSRHILYDNANRPVLQINALGEVTETAYDAAGNLIAEVAYGERLSAATLSTLASEIDLSTLSLASIRAEVTDEVNNRGDYYIYDNANRLIYTLSRDWYANQVRFDVQEYFYDGAGRLTDEKAHANFITGLSGYFSFNNLAGSQPDVDTIRGLVNDNDNVDRLTRYFYNADGQPVATLDGEGYLTETIYNAAGQVKFTFARANQLTLPGIAFEDLDTAQKAELLTIQSSGSLSEIRGLIGPHPDDQKTTYYYNARGQLIGEVDVDAYLTEYRYDLAGNLEETLRYANPVANAVALTANESLDSLRPAASTQDQRVVSNHDALNRVTQQSEFRNGSSIGRITEYRYDDQGQLISTRRGVNTSDVRTTQRQYDLRGRLTAELSAKGSEALAALPANPGQALIDAVWDQHSVRYTYDNNHRRTSSTDQNGNVRYFFYDGNNRLRYTFTLSNKATTEVEISETVYNSFGQVSDSVRYGTRLDLASSGLPIADLTAGDASRVESYVTGLADAQIDSRTTTRYTTRGAIAAILNSETPAGEERTLHYNAFGEQTAEMRWMDNYTRFNLNGRAFDRRGLVVENTRVQTFNDNLSAYTRYDAFGRVIQTTDANGNVVDYAYSHDSAGRAVVTTSDAIGSRSVVYDAFDRIVEQHDANGDVTYIDFQSQDDNIDVRISHNSLTTHEEVRNVHGEQVADVDGLGAVKQFDYDKNGNLITETDREGHVISHEYDDANRRTRTTDANGRITEYRYDDANRLSQRIVDPTGLNLITEYRYDPKGQRFQTIDPNGTVTETDYDRDGRITAVVIDPTVTDADTGAVIHQGLDLRTEYSFDAAGNTLTVTEGAGTADARTTQYRYDNLNRRTDEIVDPYDATENPDGLNLVTHYTYDDNDNVISRTDGYSTTDATTTRFVYDGQNRQTWRINGEGELSRNVYDAEGNVLKTIAYSDAIDVTLLPTLDTPVSETDILALLDPAGNRDTAQDRVQRYVYDNGGRLRFSIDAEGAVTRRHLDTNGNVIKTVQYGQALSQLELDQVDATPTFTYLNNLVREAGRDHSQDRASYAVYDNNERLRYSIDALQYVTEVIYDNAGQVIQRIEYANALPSDMNTLGEAPSVYSLFVAQNLTPDAALDRVTRYAYDNAGRQTFSIDALGYVTENVFDASGRVIETIRYADAIPLQDNVGIQNNTHYLMNQTTTPMILEPQVGGHALVLEDFAYDDMTPTRVTAFIADGGSQPTTLMTATYDSVNSGAANGYMYSVETVDNWQGEVNISDTALAAGEYDIRILLEDAAYATLDDALANGSYLNDGTNYYGDGDGVWRSMNSFKVRVDSNGNITQVLHTPDSEQIRNLLTTNSAQDQYTKTVYDTAGRTHYSVDAMGFVSETLYDERGNVTQSIRHYDAVTLSDTDTTVSDIQAALQARTAPTTDKDQVTEYIYDDADRIITETHALGAPEQYSEHYDYDALGNVVRHQDGRGNFEYFAYDNAGRLTRTIDAEGYVVDKGLNEFGQMVYERTWMAPVSATPTDIYWAYGSDTDIGLAATDNVIDPVTGQATVYGDRIKYYTYDLKGRLETETSPSIENDSQVVVEGGLVTRYRYDAYDNATDVIEAEGSGEQQWTHRVYDSRNQLIELTQSYLGENPLTTRYAYDAFGNIADIVDPRGVELSEEDSTWALSERLRLGVAIDEGSVIRAKLANELTTNDVALLTGLYTTHYTYDARGMKTTTQRIESIDPEISYRPGYGLSDQAAYYYYDNTGTLQYLDDSFGGFTSVIDPENSFYQDVPELQLVTEYEEVGSILFREQPGLNVYGANGELLKSTDLNGDTTHYYYNSVGVMIGSIGHDGVVTARVSDVSGQQGLSLIDQSASSASLVDSFFDGQGNGQMFWVSSQLDNDVIYFKTMDAPGVLQNSSWGSTQEFFRSAGSILDFHVEYTSSGRAVAVWLERVAGQDQIRASYFDGTSWSHMQGSADTLETYGLAIEGFNIDVNDNNEAVVAWETLTFRGAYCTIYKAGVWQNSVFTGWGATTSEDSTPDVFIDNAGNISLIWRTDGAVAGEYNIEFRQNIAGTWGSVQSLGSVSGDYKISGDGNGNLAIVYGSSAPEGDRILNAQIYVASGPNAGWGAVQVLDSETHVADRVATDNSVMGLVFDDNGSVIFIWKEVHSSTDDLIGLPINLYSRRFSTAEDLWSDTQIVTSTNLEIQNVHGVVDNQGMTSVSWEETNEYSNPAMQTSDPFYSRLYVAQQVAVDSWGEKVLISNDRLTNIDQLDNALYSMLSYDASDGLHVSWVDVSDSTSNVYDYAVDARFYTFADSYSGYVGIPTDFSLAVRSVDHGDPSIQYADYSNVNDIVFLHSESIDHNAYSYFDSEGKLVAEVDTVQNEVVEYVYTDGQITKIIRYFTTPVMTMDGQTDPADILTAVKLIPNVQFDTTFYENGFKRAYVDTTLNVVTWDYQGSQLVSEFAYQETLVSIDENTVLANVLASVTSFGIDYRGFYNQSGELEYYLRAANGNITFYDADQYRILDVTDRGELTVYQRFNGYYQHNVTGEVSTGISDFEATDWTFYNEVYMYEVRFAPLEPGSVTIADNPYQIIDQKLSSRPTYGVSMVETEYDAFGNQVVSRDADGNTIFQYFDKNNRMRLHVDAERYATLYLYDSRDNLVEAHQFHNKVQGYIDKESMIYLVDAINPDEVPNAYVLKDIQNDKLIASYFDLNDNKTAQLSGMVSTVNIDVDANGAASASVETVNEILGVETWGYDDNGNIISHTEANGYQLAYGDDEWTHQIKQQFGFVHADGTVLLASELDASQQQALLNLYTTVYSYDRKNQLHQRLDPVSKSVQTSPDKSTTQYDYDALGNLIRETEFYGWAGERINEYVYDNLDRKRSSVMDSSGVALARVFDYSDAGQIDYIENESGYVTQNIYDNVGRLVRVVQDPINPVANNIC
jgi:YD repeat-containing protein